MKKQLFLAGYLTLITFTCGTILFHMNNITLPLIRAQEQKAQQSALTKVMPKAINFSETEKGMFKAISKTGELCGYIFKVDPVGYGGAIDMLVGISNRAVTGIFILKHTETPGLGAKAEESSFQQQFVAKSIEDSFKAKKDIKAITGSTITSQAVADGIRTAIQKYNQITLVKD